MTKPLAQVSMSIEELIPTAQYANVKIGPVVVTRSVEDTPEAIQKGLDDCYNLVGATLSKKRQALLEAVQAAGIK